MNRAGASPDCKKIVVVRGSDISLKPIDWLWPDWLACGKVHILAGKPGTYKSTTALGLAAAISMGGQWPDGSQAQQGKVVMWSGEDAISDTLAPRLAAAGGDLAEVFFISEVEQGSVRRGFDPARDMDELASLCSYLGEPRLVVIDPIVSVAKGDSHKNAETRRDLQPLIDLAVRTNAAVLGIHHLTKRSEGADPVDRVSGSLAFGAAPRVIMLSAQDTRRGPSGRCGVLMRAKSNIGPSFGGYRFTAEQRPLDDEPHISAQRILWGDFVDKTARDILSEIEGDAEKRAQALRRAAEFVRDALTQRGPRLAAEVIAEGEAAGFNERTLRRAFKKLGGLNEKPSFRSGWIWSLPELSS